MAHLATGKPAPPEWIEFTIMDRLKWTLPEVRSITLVEGLQLITMMGAEAKVHKARNG